MRIIKLPALAFAIISATVPAAAAIAASAFIYSSQQSALPCSADKAALCSNNDTMTLQFTQLPGDFFPLPPRGPLPGPPPFAHPPDIQLDARPGFVHSPRLACEERLHREAALQRYLESRLRLTPAQHEAWQKLELAAEPITSRRLELCAQLPIEDVGPPELTAGTEFIEKMLSAQVEFLRVTREPLRALLDTLTPEQRAILNRPPLVP